MDSEVIIRIATACSLAGLLLAVGLRLTFEQVLDSIRRSRFVLILLLNFLLVPLVCAWSARWAGLGRESTIAMIILGAAPFAPVVPVFARMARADIALAAGLTSIYPVLSSFLTPCVCALLLERATVVGTRGFAVAQVMLVLVSTTTLPLLAGIAINHLSTQFAQRWLRPIEILSEATGAFSLAFVTIVEFKSIVGMTAKSLLVTAGIFEFCVVAGYLLGAEKAQRRVIGLGTSNRNIALGLLVALQSFSTLHVVSAVAGHGLVMILLGLAHVGYWRLKDWCAARST